MADFVCIDAHVHLQDPRFESDRESVVARARDAGVTGMVCNGTRESDWPLVRELAARHPGVVVPCFGLHPWYAGDRSQGWEERLREALGSVASGVGEIGLDRWVEPRDEPAQELVFRRQLEIARELNRPVMVHCLRAWGWLLEVLGDTPPLPRGMLLHAYGGSVELIDELAGRGAYFSFGGDTLREGKHRKRQALLAVPIERLLVETDAPDLPPPHRYAPHARPDGAGAPRNEPANLPRIIDGLAEVRGMTMEDLAAVTTENARRFLGRLRP